MHTLRQNGENAKIGYFRILFCRLIWNDYVRTYYNIHTFNEMSDFIVLNNIDFIDFANYLLVSVSFIVTSLLGFTDLVIF